MRERQIWENDQQAASAFDEWIEKTISVHGADAPEEPRTLQISYTRNQPGTNKIELQQESVEVVFEDPEDCEKQPRLLVSLQSVLALKGLCEREHERAGLVTHMLEACRTAYFKELLWLREQLVLATRPENHVVWDYVLSYEVYWYDPPSYVNEELKEFMLDCNRITNKKLIEEIYSLKVELGQIRRKDERARSDEAEISRLMKRIGAARILRRMYVLVGTKEHGPPQSKKELQDAMMDLLEGKVAKKDEDNDLRSELEALRSQIEGMDEFRRMFKQCQKDLADAKRQAAAEKARADAERERAEAERARAAQMENELARVTSEGVAGSKKEVAQRNAADRAAEAIKKSCQEMSKKMNVPMPEAPPAPPGTSKLETAVQALEKLAAMKPNLSTKIVEVTKEVDKSAGKVEELSKRIKELEELLRQARSQQVSRRVETEKAKAEVPQTADTSHLDAEIARLRKAERDALQLLEDLQAREAELKREIRRLTDELSRERSKPVATGKSKRQQELEDEVEALAMKLTKTQDKNVWLRKELNRYKRMAGEHVDSDNEDDDSEDEEGMPSFLVAYFRRVKYSSKPRWESLSEDAKLASKKRDWLFMNRMMVLEPKLQPAILASEATQAFAFLKRKADQGTMHQLANSARTGRSSSPRVRELLPPEDEVETKLEPIFAVKPGHTVSPYIQVGVQEISRPRQSLDAALHGTTVVASAAAAAASAAAAVASLQHGARGASVLCTGSRSASPSEDRRQSASRSLDGRYASPERIPSGNTSTTRSRHSSATTAIDLSAKVLASQVAALARWSAQGSGVSSKPRWLAPPSAATLAAVAHAAGMPVSGVVVDRPIAGGTSLGAQPPGSPMPPEITANTGFGAAESPGALVEHQQISQRAPSTAERAELPEVLAASVRELVRAENSAGFTSVGKPRPGLDEDVVGAPTSSCGPAMTVTGTSMGAATGSHRPPHTANDSSTRDRAQPPSRSRSPEAAEARQVAPRADSNTWAADSRTNTVGKQDGKSSLEDSALATSSPSTACTKRCSSATAGPRSRSLLGARNAPSSAVLGRRTSASASVPIWSAVGKDATGVVQRQAGHVPARASTPPNANVVSRSHSAGALPLTNARKMSSIAKARSQSGASAAAPGNGNSTATFGAEVHLPEALPPLPAGRIKKQPQPNWLSAS